jgi:hypothetical protein
MSGLKADISIGNQICPAQAQICLIKQVYAMQKSRSGAKMINLGPDKLTTYKQDTIEHIEIKGTTSCNQNTRNHH